MDFSSLLCTCLTDLNNINFIAIYSGEKASTKDWPRSLEIKGRVRLDAFEKFLHDLHKSRSRALMVHQHFALTLLCHNFSYLSVNLANHISPCGSLVVFFEFHVIAFLVFRVQLRIYMCLCLFI